MTNSDILVRWVKSETFKYFVPISLTYNWCYGYISFVMFIIQVISGIILAMWYIPHVDFAFNSIQFIMTEVEYGWFVRYLHVNCVSFVFLTMFLHILRGLYYGSYSFPRVKVWLSGILIFLLMVVTAFLGYVLPWGQMSYWGATVITSLIGVIPVIGRDLQFFIWGGYFIDQPALGKFFSAHYALPFVIIGMIGLHLIYLHNVGSNNPLGVETNDRAPLYPYLIWKDVCWFLFFFSLLCAVLYFAPNFLNHPDNSIPADFSCTPAHIVPEWYFLLFYAVLRSVPNKELGVIMMVFSILIIAVLPFLHRILSAGTLNGKFRPAFRYVFWWFVFNSILLGVLGACPLETPYLESSQVISVLYFAQLFSFLPGIYIVECFEFFLLCRK
jgi:quinol-cytochrome oxidoreductase complex cytochrome b subunit